jgi:catecholate siderophore receptor
MQVKSVVVIGFTLLVAKMAGAQSDTASRRVTNLKPVVITDSARKTGVYSTPSARSATKSETPLVNVPQSVTVISRDLMRDLKVQGMADVVRFVPGVVMTQGEGNRDQAVIRGNNTTADFFVDGVRDDAQYFRDLYNIDRVESLRGSNAMIFGRGGAGGIVNRVSKSASWTPVRALSLEAGSHDHKRLAFDAGDAVGQVAGRVNAMYQNSGMFRQGVRLRRYGVNPTAGLMIGGAMITAGYEYFDDHRTADRGIPSFRGAPAPAPLATFFGQPDSSYSEVRVHAGSMLLQRSIGGVALRSQTRAAYYDKFYQNVFPGAVDSTGTRVAISGYNNGTRRHNLFNQTEAVVRGRTGFVSHELLTGVESGRQVSENLRNTAYFNGSATSISAPFDSPTIASAVAFRPSATDADNLVTVYTSSVYVQDQAELGSRVTVIAGARGERFDLRYHNNRDGANLSRVDRMVSPRAGAVFKAATGLSLYGTYSVSHVPSSGDQFSSLNATTETLEPEAITNREAGVKWDVSSRLALTAAAYRLRRTNTTARDPNDPSKTVQTGVQQSSGTELSALGSITSRWQLALALTSQRARIVSATTAARAGATVALVPQTIVSVWNKYETRSGWGAGLGIVHQSRVYAAIDNTVTLPAFTHIDGALFLRPILGVRPQVNVENIFNSRYFSTANGNNNISPGAPRTIRIGLDTRF